MYNFLVNLYVYICLNNYKLLITFHIIIYFTWSIHNYIVFYLMLFYYLLLFICLLYLLFNLT